MPYVDCYIMPVVASRFDEYAEVARKSADIWKEFGALSVVEARADDAPVGELTSFPRSVMLEDGEIAVIGYVTFPDRTHRDAAQARMRSDARMMEMFNTVPVDGKRMIWGGFETFVNA